MKEARTRRRPESEEHQQNHLGWEAIAGTWGFYPHFIRRDAGVSSPHQIFTQGREALYNTDPRISE